MLCCFVLTSLLAALCPKPEVFKEDEGGRIRKISALITMKQTKKNSLPRRHEI